ncbi:hypothetical protein RN001_011054 [Aquatica leii]|uniref:Uncharacterized protein n=1 Tax=Aquatica leii TaxID=1421715 RepID=A0AAN7SNK7_9COLE|nr:hypothetical protein RN001_011054 [Aquatica leii]
MAEIATNKYDFNFDLGLKLNTPDEYGNVPLHTAVIRDDMHLLEHLLSHSHLDVNYRNYKGETPLILSLRMFRTNSFISKLIQAGCDINATNKFGQTCLHVALLCSSIDVLHMLIQSGANVNVQDYEQRTPLHYAVDNDNLEAVCMLLYYGIDVSVLCKDHMSAFTLALYRNRTDIAQILFPYYDEFSDADLDGYNALHLAAWHKSTLAFDLVNAGIDVNSLTFDGSSALIFSLDYDDANLFKLIWSKLNQDTFLYRKEPFLLNFIENLPFSSHEWVECMYLILESPLAFDLMDHCRAYYAYEAFEYGLFSKLLKAFYWFDVDVSDRVAILYICLSLGYTVNISDVNFASVLYGFNEELEIFLYAGDFNPRPVDLDNYFNLCPQQAFIFSVKDPNQTLVVDLFKKQIESMYYPFELIAIQNNVVNALGFFSMSFNQKREILGYCILYLEEYELIAKKIHEIPEMPSLLELSRNQARKFLQTYYSLKKPYEFHEVVRKMSLPVNLKNIISFKTPLYL